MAILIGQNIGKYTILERLGEGGMATIYKARDSRLDRYVAIKVIRTGNELDESFRQRFEREAQSLARLTHPNIVPIIDYGEEAGTPYLVMPFIPGGTLKDRMNEKMHWQEAFKLLLPIARALDYAHKHSIIHRDIKPSNILITESGEPMLSDFGVARILESDVSHGLTTTGMAVGTPEYMAPEQLVESGKSGDERSDRTNVLKDVSRVKKAEAESGAIDGRVDEYALGVVLYEMITGRTPYIADTPIAVAVKQATEPLPLPHNHAPDLPQRVEMFMIKMLAKDREQRFTSLAELAGVMDGLLHETRWDAEKTKVRKVVKEASQPRRKLPVWVVWAGGAAILLLVVIGLWIRLSTKKPLAETPVLVEQPSTTLSPTLQLTPTITPTATATPLVTRVRGQDGMVEVYVPAGEFIMGMNTDPNLDSRSEGYFPEYPEHNVYLDSYWIDEHEVTISQYSWCVQAKVCSTPLRVDSPTRDSYYYNGQYSYYPVMHVSWSQAFTYCEWVGAELPTEAQWEKAARGTSGAIYPWGNDNSISTYSNFGDDSSEVCSYPQGNSPYGACDMVGNVAEWVNDLFDYDYYLSSPSSNPQGPNSGDYYVNRGGHFNDREYSAIIRTYWSGWLDYIGFRCARNN